MLANRINQMMKKSDQRGFTLLEVLVAVSVFAIGFLAVAAMQLTANKSTRRSVEFTEATAIASDKIEELMALDYTDGLLDVGSHTDKQGKYDLQWQVAFSDVIITGTTTVDAKTINLRVSWDRNLSGGPSQGNVNLDFIKPNPIYN